jgi:hypothetical protein
MTQQTKRNIGFYSINTTNMPPNTRGKRGSAAAIKQGKKKKATQSNRNNKEDSNETKDMVVFLMEDGGIKSFESRSEADDYEEDYGQLIKTREYFATKEKMNNFVTAHKAATPTKTTVVTPEIKEMTPEEKAKFNRIKARIIDSKPTAKMLYSWKTTKRS